MKCAEMFSKMVSQGIRRAGMTGGIPAAEKGRDPRPRGPE